MKISLTRNLETAKILATEVGQQLRPFITYLAEFVQQVVQALLNGLTFSDNFDCEIKTVSLSSGQAQVIETKKTAKLVLVGRVFSQTHGLDAFAWYYDANSKLNVKATFTGSPDSALDVTIVVLF